MPDDSLLIRLPKFVFSMRQTLRVFLDLCMADFTRAENTGHRAC